MRISSALRLGAWCLPALVAGVLALGDGVLRAPSIAGAPTTDAPNANARPVNDDASARARGRRRRAGLVGQTTAPAAQPSHDAGAGAPTFSEFDAEAWLCSGVVRAPSGDAVVGAFVALGDIDTSELATADALGRFGIDDFPSYTDLTAFAVIDGVAHYGRVRADGPTRGAEIRLAPLPPTDPLRIVRVVGHDGRGVASASVQLVAGARPRELWPASPYATATAGGFLIRPARLEPPSGHMTFVVGQARDALGRSLPYGSALVTIDPWAEEQPVVVLPAGRLIAGRAERPDGGAMPHELVRCTASTPVGYDSNRMAALIGDATWTDGVGSFCFSVGASDRASVRIDAEPGEHAGAIAHVEVEDLREIVLRCAPAAFRRIHVIGDGDEPLAGVALTLTPRGLRLTTDANGDVEIPASSIGTETAEIAGGRSFESVALRLDAGTDPKTVRIRRLAAFSGIVLGPDGQPAPQVELVAGRADGFVAEWFGTRFIGRGVASAPLTLSIRGPKDSWLETEVPADADRSDLVIRLPDIRDALAIWTASTDDGAAISVRHDGVEIERRESSSSLSYFVIPERFPSADLQVGPDRRGRFALLRDVAPRGFVRVELLEGVALVGRVTTTEGHVTPYAEIQVSTSAGFRTTAKAQRDGGFLLFGIPPGPVTLIATWRDLSRQVELDAPSGSVEVIVE